MICFRITNVSILMLLLDLLSGVSAPCFAQALVEPVLLLPYTTGSSVSDYRPVIDPAGKRMVFERTNYDLATGRETDPELFIMRLGSAELPRALTPSLVSSARPDWCWTGPSAYATGPIAFSNNRGVWTIDPDEPGSLHLLPDTAGLIYPTWYGGCHQLATMNAPSALSAPITTKIDARNGSILEDALAGYGVWAGFPSLNPMDNQVMAFAGSVPVDHQLYNQDKNYIWIANLTMRPFWIAPLDRTASTHRLSAQFQGRAGWWSPDGLWITFESTRNCGPEGQKDSQYAIFIQSGSGSEPARQVTDCGWNAQHAKWFSRDSTHGHATLIVTVLRQFSKPGVNGPRGIAMLDVSNFVKLH